MWLTEPVLLLLFLGLAGFLATKASTEIEAAVQREHDGVDRGVESGSHGAKDSLNASVPRLHLGGPGGRPYYNRPTCS